MTRPESKNSRPEGDTLRGVEDQADSTGAP